jgi:phosphoribosyl 1,2-cyclic phosphodiesterase
MFTTVVNNLPGFVINLTTIAVDFWPKQGYEHLTHLFLTHAHSDHTKNLDNTWNHQFIYCSHVNLI